MITEDIKFSFIVPHYDGVITDEQITEGLASVAQSTYKNYEVLVYHDGPSSRKPIDFEQFGFKEFKYKETKKRYNDWGHSLRDLGIREASGDYIVQFNPDNILHPDGLTGIVHAIKMDEEIGLGQKVRNGGDWTVSDFQRYREMVICPIVLEGVLRAPSGALWRTRNKNQRIILDGFPVMQNNIDCMQVVISKKLWLSIGGWYDKSEQSDGVIYQKLWHENRSLFSMTPIGVNR